jgi:hypothetical protein
MKSLCDHMVFMLSNNLGQSNIFILQFVLSDVICNTCNDAALLNY